MIRRSPSFSDSLRGAFRVLRSGGNAANPFEIHRAAREVQEEREERQEFKGGKYPKPTRKGGWYSKARSDDQTVHQFIGSNGDLTSERPHVHVIHKEKQGEILIQITLQDGSHPDGITLPGDASGNEVNAAIQEMVRRMNKLL